jgi:hypothetical protein
LPVANLLRPKGACESEPLNDAGTTDCAEIVSCYDDCVAPPADSGIAGMPPAVCTTECESGHDAQGIADFNALIGCGTVPCATECGF